MAPLRKSAVFSRRANRASIGPRKAVWQSIESHCPLAPAPKIAQFERQ